MSSVTTKKKRGLRELKESFHHYCDPSFITLGVISKEEWDEHEREWKLYTEKYYETMLGLAECQDKMDSMDCWMLDLPKGSTYAQGVQDFRRVEIACKVYCEAKELQ